MARTVNCIKLGKEAEGLDFPPYPGELGKRIWESVSKEAWAAWLKHQTMLVNENRLNSGRRPRPPVPGPPDGEPLFWRWCRRGAGLRTARCLIWPPCLASQLTCQQLLTRPFSRDGRACLPGVCWTPLLVTAHVFCPPGGRGNVIPNGRACCITWPSASRPRTWNRSSARSTPFRSFGPMLRR
jgi:hypothetical protein